MDAENFASEVVTPFPKRDTWAWNPQAGLLYTLRESPS